MKHLVVFSLPSILISFAIVLSGCDLAQPQNQRQQTGQDNIPVPMQDEASEQAPVNEVPQQNEPGDNTVLTRAQVGMGAKGHYGATGGNPAVFVTTPISVMFRSQERIALQQITQAINMYEAEHGRKPATHDEFMEKIIRTNGIRLPQLPPNHEYVYDPSDGELKVRRPQ